MINENIMASILQGRPGIKPTEALEIYKEIRTGMIKIDREIESCDFSFSESTADQIKVVSKQKYSKDDLTRKPSESITDDKVYCCLCNESFVVLREDHLQKKHGLSREEYLDLCGFDPKTPLASKKFCKDKKEKAIARGFGKKQPEATPIETPTPAPTPASSTESQTT